MTFFKYIVYFLADKCWVELPKKGYCNDQRDVMKNADGSEVVSEDQCNDLCLAGSYEYAGWWGLEGGVNKCQCMNGCSKFNEANAVTKQWTDCSPETTMSPCIPLLFLVLYHSFSINKNFTTYQNNFKFKCTNFINFLAR